MGGDVQIAQLCTHANLATRSRCRPQTVMRGADSNFIGAQDGLAPLLWSVQ